MTATLVLAACSGGVDDAATANATAMTDADALPRPEGSGGSITGMPPPGQATPTPAAPMILPGPDEALAPEATDPTPHDPANPALAGIAPAEAQALPPTSPPAAMDGPGPAEAVAVLRDYYAAINAGDHAAAYRLWRPDRIGSSQQFAEGFAQTAGVSVQLGAPGPIDAGAGQRHVRIPVTVAITRRDGSAQRSRGEYVLQRTVVDGASPEQRQWRIVQADLREE